jgi:Arc/MetJ-type ribon-helix-helix transcriptional regulator
MSNEEKKKEEKGNKHDEENEKMVMMACCPESGEGISKQFKGKILMNLGDRCNVVMTRLDDNDLKEIDALVEIEAFKSRSEAVAFFIKEGIQARKDLFQKVMPAVEKIRELKEQAKKELGKKETSNG